jgi:hypothetical protein
MTELPLYPELVAVVCDRRIISSKIARALVLHSLSGAKERLSLDFFQTICD